MAAGAPITRMCRQIYWSVVTMTSVAHFCFINKMCTFLRETRCKRRTCVCIHAKWLLTYKNLIKKVYLQSSFKMTYTWTWFVRKRNDCYCTVHGSTISCWKLTLDKIPWVIFLAKLSFTTTLFEENILFVKSNQIWTLSTMHITCLKVQTIPEHYHFVSPLFWSDFDCLIFYLSSASSFPFVFRMLTQKCFNRS